MRARTPSQHSSSLAHRSLLQSMETFFHNCGMLSEIRTKLSQRNKNESLNKGEAIQEVQVKTLSSVWIKCDAVRVWLGRA